MYTMVLMMAMAGSGDTASFGWNKSGCNGTSCTGTVVATSCTGCTGTVVAASCTGCSGSVTASCHGCSGSSNCCGSGSGFLGLRKSGNHLVIEIGASDRITLSNWYAAPDNRSVLRLQVIAEAMADFDAGGADPLRDNRVETFDFAGLAGAFDAARAANPGLTRWAIAEALTAFHLAGSDSEALGGDLAYQYGRNGTLAGIGLGAAQAVLGDAQFGVQAQALRPLAGLQDGPLRLG